MLLEFCNFKIIWSLNDLIIGRHGRDKQFYKALQLLLEFFSSNSVLYLYLNFEIQQGLKIHGLEEHGPWRYTVFNWISKHLRYTVLGQKP